MKNPNNWRRFSPQLLGSIEKADVAIRVGQKIQKKLLECFSQIIFDLGKKKTFFFSQGQK